MKKTRVTILLLVAVLFVFGSVIAANAACSTYGKIMKMYVSGTTSSPFAKVWVQPLTSGVPGYCYYFNVNRGAVIDALSDALAGQRTVYVSGNASSCPTGVYRYGGYVNYMYVYNTR